MRPPCKRPPGYRYRPGRVHRFDDSANLQVVCCSGAMENSRRCTSTSFRPVQQIAHASSKRHLQRLQHGISSRCLTPATSAVSSHQNSSLILATASLQDLQTPSKASRQIAQSQTVTQHEVFLLSPAICMETLAAYLQSMSQHQVSHSTKGQKLSEQRQREHDPWIGVIQALYSPMKPNIRRMKRIGIFPS